MSEHEQSEMAGVLQRIEALETAARVNAAGDEERLRRVAQAEARAAETESALSRRIGALEAALAGQAKVARETASDLATRLESAYRSIDALSAELARLQPAEAQAASKKSKAKP